MNRSMIGAYFALCIDGAALLSEGCEKTMHLECAMGR